MRILALDTCLGACSAAIVEDEFLVAARSEPMRRGHQERLAPMIQELMAEAGLAFRALDRIAVTVGPGSFTGLRVGLAFAKGLALALGRPCVGVGTLEALAASLERPVRSAAVIDAGRGQLYFQLFDGRAALTAPDVAPVEIAAARLVEILGLTDFTLVGPGVAALEGGAPRAARREIAAPAPEAIASLALTAAATPPRPLYLRAPDARPKRP